MSVFKMGQTQSTGQTDQLGVTLVISGTETWSVFGWKRVAFMHGYRVSLCLFFSFAFSGFCPLLALSIVLLVGEVGEVSLVQPDESKHKSLRSLGQFVVVAFCSWILFGRRRCLAKCRLGGARPAPTPRRNGYAPLQ